MKDMNECFKRKNVSVEDLHFGMVVSWFHRGITEELQKGVMDVLESNGVLRNRMKVVYVPGALEIPYGAKQVLKGMEKDGGRCDCVITLGCVIEGETFHFQQVLTGYSYGVQKVSLTEGCPIINGVLWLRESGQAKERITGGLKDRGREAGFAALEMAALRGLEGRSLGRRYEV